ncbi:hypothetical protein [Paenibacillus ginsengarvi]|uniref:Pectate lyase superfamily protein domain-containing protein n=1 Tax=Paenibacillus ginsengarvi TaxID=400777 RepID=A0A3B0C1R4_9BACL|nr:hypothetical protein [Paenibacillus ginsengarvi]RKN78811.1 hypothetical protein D7M11_22285 [Paenibacillus ginsengarvi]
MNDQETNNNPEAKRSSMSRRKMLAFVGVAGAAALTIGGSTAFIARKQASGSKEEPAPESYTLTELKQASGLRENAVIRTTGYYESGDGGGAEYIIRADKSLPDGGSVVDLQNGLQAHLLPVSGVTYKMFGARGDGKNDDGVQIKLAHAYANRQGCPIVNTSGEYWIKETNLISIATSVEWGHTKFHIDESFNSKSNPRFQVISRKKEAAIPFDAAAKTAFLAKMKPGTTLIPELAPYKNSLVFVVDSNDKIGVRYGYNHNGWNREDFFYVEEHGRIVGDIAWTFTNYTSLVAYPCDDNYLVIDGGTFYMSGTSPGANGSYLHNGIMVKRSRTILRNQWVGLDQGAVDVSLDPRSGFYYFTNVFDVTLENVRLIPWEQDREGTAKDVPAGTYGIGGARVLNATFRNVTAEGSNVHWGVFGTNMFKNFRIEGCRLNRVDVHFHCWNLYVKDSEIGYKGFTLTGGGDLFIENTKRFGTRFIDFRNDYGAKWDGNIRLNNCRLVLTSGTAEAVGLHFVPADFDYKYPIGYGRSIKIQDFIFDYTGVPNPTGVCRMMKIAAFSKVTSSGARLFFPSSIECSDVIVVGREKGVRLLEIQNPLSYDVGKAGGYDENRVTANCYMRFANIQGEKVPAQASQSNTHVNFLLNALGTAAYDDANALYPKIDIVNCGDFFGHFKGAIADVYFSDCTVNCVDAYEGGPMRGRIAFDNCHIQADTVDDGKAFYSLSSTGGVSFVGCTIHAPIVDGAQRPELLSRYDFIDVNRTLHYHHLGTRLSKRIMDHYAPVAPEYIAMLKSHHESESPQMLRRRGTSAQRPAAGLTGLASGFGYYDTDKGEWVVWDGAGWMPPVRQEESLHYYVSGSALTSPGEVRMKRMEGHPTDEYTLRGSGRAIAYSVYADESLAGVYTFDLWKNGAVWHAGLNVPEGQLSAWLPLDNSVWSAGDRIAVKLLLPNLTDPVPTGVTFDLLIRYGGS